MSTIPNLDYQLSQVHQVDTYRKYNCILTCVSAQGQTVKFLSKLLVVSRLIVTLTEAND